MIIEMALAAQIAHGTTASRGSSDIAAYVAKETEDGRRHLQESYSFGMAGKGAFDALFQTFQECRLSNWDGYGARPVQEETYWISYRILEALPLGVPAPSIGAEPDGHLTLEWHHSSRRTLSISVSPEGELHFAALLGSAKQYGTEPFIGGIPKVISDLISRVKPTA